MQYEQRAYARVKFLELMAELHENEFEDFFHRLMCSRYPDFLDVRTAGRHGDMSADGLGLRSRKLYACYAPQTVDPYEIRRKFDKDLSGALAKRSGEFDTFVFVHNDHRGVHPKVSSLLASAAANHPDLKFEQMGQPPPVAGVHALGSRRGRGRPPVRDPDQREDVRHQRGRSRTAAQTPPGASHRPRPPHGP